LGSLSGDEARTEVHFAGLPAAEEISNVPGLEHYDSDAMWDSFYPTMERLGIGFTWRCEDESVRLLFRTAERIATAAFSP
jgi:hypothetical protein